jgi:predicted dehydrogenase
VFRDGTSEVLPSERGAWPTFYPAFAAAVRGAGPVPVNPWDAVATAQILDAARESATTGQVIRLQQ